MDFDAGQMHCRPSLMQPLAQLLPQLHAAELDLIPLVFLLHQGHILLLHAAGNARLDLRTDKGIIFPTVKFELVL